MKKKINKLTNTIALNRAIARGVYVKSLQELVLTIEEQKEEIEYYKHKNKIQRQTIKDLRNKLKILENKKRR